MKAVKTIALFVLISIISQKTSAQNPENWTSKQLIEPSELAQAIQSEKDKPLIISVGPGATIPHSLETGMAKEQENLDKFKKELSTVPKETKIVIYCGCCPFEHCPNVRPAIAVLNDMKFTNYHLLNLPHNIKADWIDKGYPVSKQ
ncbi:MAG: rhodanese-like domain-containing protein [Segetibacter sp.]